MRARGLVVLIVLLSAACGRSAAATPPAGSRQAGASRLALGTRVAAGPAATSRDQLARTIALMDARLAARPDDSASAVTLAEALMRQGRVTGNAGLARRAEAALDAVLAARPDDYDVIRRDRPRRASG